MVVRTMRMLEMVTPTVWDSRHALGRAYGGGVRPLVGLVMDSWSPTSVEEATSIASSIFTFWVSYVS
jgi:hypothetical protein